MQLKIMKINFNNGKNLIKKFLIKLKGFFLKLNIIKNRK